MAEISHVLARLKRDPIADLPIAAHLPQLLRENAAVWRERLLPPLVTLRLFQIQVLSGNCAIALDRNALAFPPLAPTQRKDFRGPAGAGASNRL